MAHGAAPDPASDQAGWPAPTATAGVDAVVPLPGSKSQTNRALVLAALADPQEGPRRVMAPLRARDTTLMAAALGALGAAVTDAPGGPIRGAGTPAPGSPAAPAPPTGAGPSLDWVVHPAPPARTAATVDTGLAGTVARFLPPVAALGDAPIRFVGDPRMSARPLGPLAAALRELGAHVDGDAVPLSVRGPARGGAVTVNAADSSQLISGLLLTAPSLPNGLTLTHHGPPLPSADHIAMTVAALRAAGADVDTDTDRAGHPRWRVLPAALRPGDVVVEPDLSTATAFTAAAAVTAGTVRVPGWPARTAQPGRRWPDLLRAVGCTVTGPDAAGLVVTGPGRLRGVDADLRDFPEALPVMVALAVLADGPSRFTGVAHVRLQESDRLAVLATELGRLGADITVLADGVAVRPAPLRAAGQPLDPHADHRLAMAYAVVGLAVPGVRILDIGTVGKTVPDFPARWAALLDGTPR